MFVVNYMSAPPVIIQQNTSISEVKDILQNHNFRHLPVVDADNRLIGMVTDRDIRSAYPSSIMPDEGRKVCISDMRTTPVREIMSTAFAHLNLTSTLDDALFLLDRHNVGALPVLDEEDRVVGIFSIRDLMKAYRNLFGLGERGSTMIVVRDDGNAKPLTRIAGILEEHGINVTRLVRTEPEKGKDTASIYLRVNTYNVGAVHSALKKAGFIAMLPTAAAPKAGNNQE
jgi:acetoin utilization protein AcuB